jgi:hypothetical protein
MMELVRLARRGESASVRRNKKGAPPSTGEHKSIAPCVLAQGRAKSNGSCQESHHRPVSVDFTSVWPGAPFHLLFSITPRTLAQLDQLVRIHLGRRLIGAASDQQSARPTDARERASQVSTQTRARQCNLDVCAQSTDPLILRTALTNPISVAHVKLAIDKSPASD